MVAALLYPFVCSIFREKPLVLYLFAKDNDVIANFVDNTSSGGMCVNDTMMHMGGLNLIVFFCTLPHKI